MMSVRQGLHIGCFSDPLRAFKFCMKTPVFRLHLFLFIGFFSDAVRAFKICIKTPVVRLHVFLHISFFSNVVKGFQSLHQNTCSQASHVSTHCFFFLRCCESFQNLHQNTCRQASHVPTFFFSSDAVKAFKLCIRTPVFRLHVFLHMGFFTDVSFRTLHQNTCIQASHVPIHWLFLRCCESFQTLHQKTCIQASRVHTEECLY